MKLKRVLIKYLLFVVLITIVGCSPTSNLQKNTFLLNKNKVSVKNSPKAYNNDNIEGLLQQRPNKRFLGLVRIKPGIYNWTSKRKWKFWHWIQKTFGEKPVVYNKNLTHNSINDIKLYLNSTGYFNSSVKDSVKIKKKKINVYYDINLSEPFRTNNITYNIKDSILRKYVFNDISNSLIKKGNIYNVYTLDDERERITNYLKNNGYFNFSKEYIFFKIDSSLNSHQFNISLDITNPTIPSKSDTGKLVEENHKRYFINNIFVNPNYKGFHSDTIKYDTLLVNVTQGKNSEDSSAYHFIYYKKLRIKPSTITQSLLINQGDPFNLSKVKKTYKRLSGLQLYRHSNISFIRSKSSFGTDPYNSTLDCKIKMTRAYVQSFSIETEGTNSGGDLGIGGNFVYQNKNIFRGAETLYLKLKGSAEVQKLTGESDQLDAFLFFNTIETGIDLSLHFPKFLLPVNQEKFPKFYNPKTTISTGLNYQKRPNYRRYIWNFSFGYNWKESDHKKYILFPFDINLIKIFPDSAFQKELDDLKDQRLKQQYTDHLITAINYSFIYNNQDINKLKNFFYFRGNIETAGNTLNLIDNFVKAQKNLDDNYTLFNIQYSQYVRSDIDFRYYNIIDRNKTIVFRTLLGIGIPYGNSEVLPFEKGFYEGGANGMRGWVIRSLGPGSYNETGEDIDKIGDIQIEGNIEYRFPIYKQFKGALFTDIGNIWLLKSNTTFPGGQFEFDKFFGQLAIDGGFGFRFDFDFFIFRIDGALKLKDPSKPKGERWIVNKARFDRIMWNFGIGYPF
ncbi:MAG: BamA/TamA family outer membrane protein [Bacteroidales bacterium]|nr:BamA/TamA family outer membrane protein [Bacteroidales bacterium]